GAGNLEDLGKTAGLIAQDAKAGMLERIAAVRALGQLKGSRQELRDLLDNEHAPADLRVEVALALGKHAANPAVFDQLQEVAAVRATPLAVRQAAAAALIGPREGSTWLMEVHEQKFLPDDLTPDLARLLRGSPFIDIRKKAFAAFPPPPPLDPKSLPSIQALLARKGNAERGKQLIAASIKSDAQCLKCHTIHGVGGQAGPDLSTIGSKASRENLLESILYPSRAIADQYQQYLVETKTGISVNGIIIEETKE